MMKKVSLLVITTFFLFLSVSNASDSLLANAQKASVLIDAKGGQGSGVLTINNGHIFCWTDAHVVADCQKIEKVYDAFEKREKVHISYDDVWVCQDIREEGRKVGQYKYLAKIIRFSTHQDIALLMLYKKTGDGLLLGSATFATAGYIPKVGAALWHVGCPGGTEGAGTVSECVFSVAGRLKKFFEGTDTAQPIIYDQVCGQATYGSSGGGIFEQSSGHCVGLVTEYLTGGQNWLTEGIFCITPARRLHEFAEKNRCKWAMTLDTTPSGPELLNVITDDVINLKDIK